MGRGINGEVLGKVPILDPKKWRKEIHEENLSTEDLNKRLSKETMRIKPKRKYFEKRKDGFKIYPLAYNPDSTTREEKCKILQNMKMATEILRKW